MKLKPLTLSFGLVIATGFVSASESPSQMNQQTKEQGPMAPGMAGHNDEEVAHPFLTHMGMPEGVGTNSLRISGLTTSAGGKSRSDFGFHYETGLSKLVGFHLRSDAFTTDPFTEAMFQYAAIVSKDGMSGISPHIEFEFPTRRAGSGIKTLYGFSSTLTLKHGAINQVIHYDPREKMVEGSVAYVCEPSPGFYPVFELLGMGSKGEKPTLSFLIGPKVKLSKDTIAGIAYETPISARKEFGSKFIAQLELKW